LQGVTVEIVSGSLSNRDALQKATINQDLVFHVAAAVTDWGSLEYFRAINVDGTRNAIEAAILNQVPRFLYVSSVAVSSFSDQRNMEEDAPQLPTPYPYCQTKREAEDLVNNLHRSGKIQTVIVRPGDIYGPNDRVALLRMGEMLRRNQLPYVAGGNKLGAFTYIDNLVEGMVLASTNDKAYGRTYILTDGVEMSWRTYFVKLTDALGYPHPSFSVYPQVGYAAAFILENIYRVMKIQQRPPISRYLINHLSTDFHFSIERARVELGYQPIDDMDETIRRTADWYKSYMESHKKK
jgi:nucleoside-diphosphate-sugar epimerase